MKVESKFLLIEYDVENNCLDKYKHLYLKASKVFGNKLNMYNKSKFQHLYNVKFYKEALDDYANCINKELENIYKKTHIIELCILNYFELHNSKPFLLFFLIRKIKDIFYDYKIILLTSNKIVKILKEKYNFLGINDIELFYILNANLNLSHIKSILFFPNKLYFVFINIGNISFYLFKLLLFKLKNKTSYLTKIDILYLSGSFKYWNKEKKNYIFDYYYRNSFYKLDSNSSLNLWILTPQMTNNKILINYCLYKYINVYTLTRTFYNSIINFFKILPYLEDIWSLQERGLIKKLFFMKNLEYILSNLKPKALIYYDEVYCFGRIISIISNKLNVDSYGFQHSIVTYLHPTYKSINLYKNIPEIFPRFFFIYGNYSKKLFSDYGYPVDRMIEVGFDRIRLFNYDKTNQKDKDKFKVLFIGQTQWTNEYFGELYCRQRRFSIKKIFFRPHPGFFFNREKFLNQYPEVVLIDPKIINADTNIRDVDCVIGNFSTVLLNAIYLNKITISWQPFGLEDLIDLNYWGAQIVKSLDDINWEKRPNSNKVKREFTPRVDLVKFLEFKYIEKNKNKDD